MTRPDRKLPGAGVTPSHSESVALASRGIDELTSVDPATGKELATVPFSSADDIDDTVRTGNEAFDEWSKRPVDNRI